MEGVPSGPAQNPNEKSKEKLRKTGKIAAALFGGAIAAASPVNKATPDTIPLVTEKLVVRPEDVDETALKADIEAKRATFEIDEDGEIKRVS